MTNTDQPVVSRPWIILLLLCLPVFIGSLDLTIVSAILPEVINQLRLPLDTKLDDASWMVSGYLLAYTISMTFMGRISDMVGRRWVYVVCLVVFVFGSWFVSIAHTWPTDWYLRVYRWIYPNPDTHIPPSQEMRELYMIIMGRTIQAFGAGAIVPVTMAIVSDIFPANRRARPLGLVGAIDTSGWVLGHLYGGAMVKFFGVAGNDIVAFFDQFGINIGYPDWRTLFLLNIPFSLIALGVALYALRGPAFKNTYRRAPGLLSRLIHLFPLIRPVFVFLRPPSRNEEGAQASEASSSSIRFDYLGAALITLALSGLSIALGSLSPESAFGGGTVSFDELASAGNGNDTSFVVPLLIASAISFVAFIYWELHTRYPLIDLRLFLKRNYSSAGFTNLCVGFTLAIGLVSVPLVINLRADSSAQEAFQDAALVAGLVLSGLTVPMALAAFPGGWLSDRFGYRNVTVTGMGLAMAGFILCSLTWTADISPWIMGGEMIVIGIGLGLTMSPVATALINEVREGERGVSAALVLILRLVGMTLAISGMTSYALYRVEQRISALGSFDNISARQDAYIDVTVAQVNELFLIGAGVSLLALLVALRLQGGRVHPDTATAARVRRKEHRSGRPLDITTPAEAHR
ncbi:MAG: MFS transporter [Chloroflexi bacterium]|nr:MFS transporter [Chloroflexota bacterium]